ncbi:hypothetical protein Spith_2048 [Spirochaeta thermophila DSM 6578]|uniref:Uncharacterized protein n=2 Tax=Winmispira thermophila TaxID=154 RepID=G0GEG8_WINT7|nr:hypothetical protein Spith_2048 [Spirochaeta thermophila DSM 6578]
MQREGSCGNKVGMRKIRNARSILFIPDPPADAVPLGELEEFLGSLPGKATATWNIPVCPFLEDERWRRFLERRIAVGDELVSMGYAGVPLHLLSPQEQEDELAWALHNPWWSGTYDLWHFTPRAYHHPAGTLSPLPPTFPQTPLTTLLSPSRPFHGRLASPQGALPLVHLPFLLLSSSPLRTLTRALLSPDPLVLLMTPGPDFAAQADLLLTVLLDLDRKGHTFSFEPLPDPLPLPPTQHLTPLLVPLPSVPHVDRLRAMDEDSEEHTRLLLQTLSAYHPTPAAPLPPAERTLGAHMEGRAILSDEGIHVEFEGGLPVLVASGPGPAHRLPAPQVELAGKKTRITVQSAFSLEGEHVRGLRTLLSAAGTTPLATADFLLVEGFPHLILDLALFPEALDAPWMSRLHPLSLPLPSSPSPPKLTLFQHTLKSPATLETPSLLCAPTGLLVQTPDSHLLVQPLSPWAPVPCPLLLQASNRGHTLSLTPLPIPGPASPRTLPTPLRTTLLVSPTLTSPLPAGDLPPQVLAALFPSD